MGLIAPLKINVCHERAGATAGRGPAESFMMDFKIKITLHYPTRRGANGQWLNLASNMYRGLDESLLSAPAASSHSAWGQLAIALIS